LSLLQRLGSYFSERPWFLKRLKVERSAAVIRRIGREPNAGKVNVSNRFVIRAMVLAFKGPVAAPASLGVFECLRLSRETQQPFAGDQLKRLASRNLPGLSLGARVNPIGDELASIVAPLEYDRP